VTLLLDQAVEIVEHGAASALRALTAGPYHNGFFGAPDCWNKLAVRKGTIRRRIIRLLEAIANELGWQPRREIAMFVDRVRILVPALGDLAFIHSWVASFPIPV
jgi:hypothetical protein